MPWDDKHTHSTSGLFVALMMGLRNISSHLIQLERGLIAVSVGLPNILSGLCQKYFEWLAFLCNT
jgi:hypothetical protein